MTTKHSPVKLYFQTLIVRDIMLSAILLDREDFFTCHPFLTTICILSGADVAPIALTLNALATIYSLNPRDKESLTCYTAKG